MFDSSLCIMKYLILSSWVIFVTTATLQKQDCKRDYIISNLDQFKSAKNCERFGGRLTIAEGAPEEIELSIETINGGLSIQTSNIKKLFFENLENINGDLLIQNSPSLDQINLKNLKTINGEFRINQVPNLNNFDTPKLMSVNGKVDLSGLKSTKNPLRQVNYINGDLILNDIQKLKSMNFDKLFKIGGNIKIMNSDTTAMSFPNLHTICTTLTIKQVANLETLNLKSIQAYSIKLDIQSDSLKTINLGKLVPAKNSQLLIQNSEKVFKNLNNQTSYECNAREYKNPSAPKDPFNSTPTKNPNNAYDTLDPNSSLSLLVPTNLILIIVAILLI